MSPALQRSANLRSIVLNSEAVSQMDACQFPDDWPVDEARRRRPNGVDPIDNIFTSQFIHPNSHPNSHPSSHPSSQQNAPNSLPPPQPTQPPQQQAIGDVDHVFAMSMPQRQPHQHNSQSDIPHQHSQHTQRHLHDAHQNSPPHNSQHHRPLSAHSPEQQQSHRQRQPLPQPLGPSHHQSQASLHVTPLHQLQHHAQSSHAQNSHVQNGHAHSQHLSPRLPPPPPLHPRQEPSRLHPLPSASLTLPSSSSNAANTISAIPSLPSFPAHASNTSALVATNQEKRGTARTFSDLRAADRDTLSPCERRRLRMMLRTQKKRARRNEDDTLASPPSLISKGGDKLDSLNSGKVSPDGAALSAMDKKTARVIRNREVALRARQAAKAKMHRLESENSNLKNRATDLERENSTLKMQIETLKETLQRGEQPQVSGSWSNEVSLESVTQGISQ